MFNRTAALTRSSRGADCLVGEGRDVPGEQNCDLGFLEKSWCKAQTIMVVTSDAGRGAIRPGEEKAASDKRPFRRETISVSIAGDFSPDHLLWGDQFMGLLLYVYRNRLLSIVENFFASCQEVNTNAM
ncbi:MAG TPA: hypothetical protein VJ810_20655 [Blastocatellia bacterium]|nr:hypothetical protein [Blastocatellia bacterium]